MTERSGSTGRSDADLILTLPQFLEQGAARWGGRLWCRTPDGSASREGILADARVVAGALRRNGVGPGVHVVVVLPNSLDFVRVWFGVALAGAVTIPLNPRAALEVALIVKSLAPSLVVAEPGIPMPGVHTRVLGPEDLLQGEPGAPVAATTDSPGTYIQTSGTTGGPKFVIETHGMLTMAGEGFPFWLGLTEEDVLLTALPLSHLNAQAYSVLGSYYCGAELALLPRFSASTFWEEAIAYGATEFNAIGAMLEALMRREPREVERSHRVRICYSAPAPPEERHREIEDRFGFRLVIGYALSESPYGLIVAPDGPRTYGAMGRPRQHPRLGRINEVRIVDPEGRDVGPGESGEILLRSPAVTPGYYGKPEDTAKAIRDGWLHTGDLARRDEKGNHYFCGRIKDVIRYKGENLSAAEVESAIDSHPAVTASAVIGVPSELSEEDVKAFVVLRPGHSLSSRELGEWCEDRLAPYKRPRYVEFIESFPLTATHKIAKTELPKERTAAEIDLWVGGKAPRPAG